MSESFGFLHQSKHGFHQKSEHDSRGTPKGWIYPNSWCLNKITFPDTNFENDIGYASTGLRNTWSSQSKTAFKFQPELCWDVTYPINIGRIGANMRFHTELIRSLGLSPFGGQLAWDGGGPIQFEFWVKVRLLPIISPLDTSTLTWNTLLSLTLAPPIEIISYGTDSFRSGGSNIRVFRRYEQRIPDVFGSAPPFNIIPNNSVGISGFNVPKPMPEPESETFPGFLMEVLFDFVSNPDPPGINIFPNSRQQGYLGLTVENECTVYL